MKKTCFVVLIVITLVCGCGRTIPRDKQGNPIFNSRAMGEFTLTNCSIAAYYYTITSNVENRGSGYFVADNPTPKQVKRFAVSTPVFFFIIHTNRFVNYLVKLEQNPSAPPGRRFAFGIIGDPQKPGRLVQMPYTATIADMRAAEIYHSPWKHDAVMTNIGNKAFFWYNAETNEMLLFPKVVEDLKKLINDQELYKKNY